MEGQVRLADGAAGPGYEYGRLEAFRRGFWGNVGGAGGFSPESAQVACMTLGFDGGSVLRFSVPYETGSVAPVRPQPTGSLSMHVPPVWFQTSGMPPLLHMAVAGFLSKQDRDVSCFPSL